MRTAVRREAWLVPVKAVTNGSGNLGLSPKNGSFNEVDSASKKYLYLRLLIEK